MRGVVGEVAQPRCGVRHAVERDVGEQRRHAAAAVDFVNGAGAAFIPAHDRAIAGAGDDVEAEQGGGGDINVRRGRVVERDTENLADVLGEHIESLGRRKQPAVPDITRPGEIDDAGRRSVGIDEGEVGRGPVRAALFCRDGAGKSGDHRVTRYQIGRLIALLRAGMAGMKENEQ